MSRAVTTIGENWQRVCRLWSLDPLLWSPCVIGQTIIFLPCDFYLLSSFFLA